MFTSHTVLFLSALLLIAVPVRQICTRLHIPWPVVLVLLGFAASEFTTRFLQLDTGIRWHNFDIIILYGLIPVLIFKAALTLDVQAMKKDILHVLMLSFPVFVCITLVTGLIIYFAIDHADGFPIVAAMLAAALLSATDPAVAISTLEEAGTSSRVRSLLEGESLFNDAVAIVLFALLLSMALNHTVEITWLGVVRYLIGVFAGGILIGLVLAWITHFLLMAVRDSHACTILTLVTAYLAYILAEDIFHVSGVMAVLAAGLLTRHLDFNDKTDKKISDSLCFWDTVSELSGMMIFLLAGVTITLNMFTERWLAMLYAVVAVFLVRIALVIPALTAIGKLPWTTELGMRQQFTVCWGGARGTITLALALSLPLSLDYYYTIQSMAYGVVLFTLFIQAPTIGLVAGRNR